jgi:DNA (cytosine-5)-methyltransferase 1
LSLFAGAGGLDLGFAAAGFESVAFVELESWACATLRANHPDAAVFGPPHTSGDVADVTVDSLNRLGSKLGSPDVVIGGPPCQPFSIAAAQRFVRSDDRFKRTGHADPLRGGLFKQFIRVVEETEPRAFMLENVPGLLHLDDGKSLAAMQATLEAAGYHLSQPVILEAAEFGVPQFRQRVFLLGARSAAPEPPSGRRGPHGSLLPGWLTVAHALAGMPQDLPNHLPRRHEAASIARYRQLAFGQREPLGRVDRLDPRRPSKTVIAGGSGGGGRSHLHPFIARTLTVRECARLQTFPDDYVFEGSNARQFTQVGNAVPPLLGEQLARQIGIAEFHMTYPDRLTSASYLDETADLERLVEQLHSESFDQKRTWLYLDATHPAEAAA